MAKLTKIRNSSNTSFSARCNKRRSFPFQTKEDSIVIHKVAAEKTVLKDALYSNPKWKIGQIKQALDYEYSAQGADFDMQTVKTQSINMMGNLITRYVLSENRVPIPQQNIDKKCFAFPESSDIFSIKPDLIFKYTDGSGIPVIECVIIKTGKASNFTRTGNRKDGNPQHSIELYLLFCYARTIAPAGQKTIIKGSYYFLKDKNDYKNGKGMEVANYWTTKDTTFTLEDSVTKDNDGKFLFSYTDMAFKSQLIDFDKGQDADECTPEDCARCDMYAFCHYNVAPVFRVKKRKTSTVRGLNFSDAQMKVINFRKGYARTNAGAGAGKTLVVAFNVVTALEEGCKEDDFLLITFTDNGAREMRERIAAYIKDEGLDEMNDIDANKIRICTFNAFGNEIVIENYEKLGFTQPPHPIEEAERAAIIKSIADKYNFDGFDYTQFNSDLSSISFASGLDICKEAFTIIKENRLSLGDEEQLRKLMSNRCWNSMHGSLTCLTQLLEAYNEYDALLRTNNLIEYADQELLIFELLQQDPYYLEKFGFKHIIVDEFQDTSERQINILKELIDTPSFESLLVVGDDSQAIYGFRNTSPEHIINFFDEIGAPEEESFDFQLVDNYRCTPEIIEAANKYNALREKRLDKDLIAHRESLGIPVKCHGFYEKDDEIDFIIDGIKSHIKNGAKPEDIAVLGLNRNILAKIGERLAQDAIPCVNMNPEYVFDNSKVIAGIEVAKAIENPTLTKSLLIYLNAKYENTLIDMSESDIMHEVEDFSNQIQAIHDMNEKDKEEAFISLLEDIDYDSDELYEHFIDSLKFRPTFSQQLDYIKLTEEYGKRQTYKREKDYPGVVLTTMHSSKGLEWPVVYLSLNGLDMESYHKVNYGGHLDEVEEKKRLVFVSMTRARDELIITGQYEIKKMVYNHFLRDAFTVAGLDKFYIPVDPNAEIKKVEKARKKAEEVERQTKEKAERMAQLHALGLVSCDDMVINVNETEAEEIS